MKISLLLLAFCLFSCRKESSCENCTKQYEDAVIFNYGTVAADGCDWVVRIDSVHYYHPDVLDPVFKQNGLNVRICYETTTDNFICGFNPVGIPVIHVLDMKQ